MLNCWLPYLLLSFLTHILHFAVAQECKQEKVYRALQNNIENGSESFCQELLVKVDYIGTLREDPTYFFYATVTNSKSTDIVYEYAATTTKEKVTSTSFTSQQRQSSDFTMPLPTYVQQYPTPRVSKACSCLIGPGPTYTQYRNCEQATTTRSVSTTFTYTVGRPGKKTSTFTETITKTKLKSTTGPYPTTCPNAEGIDYVASDKTPWERYCKTGLNQYREIDTVKATSLNDCIEKCVDYNTKIGYKQCQAASYDPRSNDCFRVNQPGYFSHPDGRLNVGILKFLPPAETPGPDYCATVSGAA